MVGIRVFVCSFRIRTFRGLKPQPGCQAVAAAKECPEKAPSLQKAQGWATQLQRQRVVEVASHKFAAMVAEWTR
jgi:type IV secretory pathway TrbL component